MSIECPDCMPKHRADLAQPEEWRDEHGVRSEGWLHPSGFDRSLLVCNCCGRYFEETPNMLTPVTGAALSNWRRGAHQP